MIYDIVQKGFVSNLPNVWNPSCLQTTSASLLSQMLSHILLQNPLTQTSTVPILSFIPNRRRMFPSEQFNEAVYTPEFRNHIIINLQKYLDSELLHLVSDHSYEVQFQKRGSWLVMALNLHNWPDPGIFHHFPGQSRQKSGIQLLRFWIKLYHFSVAQHSFSKHYVSWYTLCMH